MEVDVTTEPTNKFSDLDPQIHSKKGHYKNSDGKRKCFRKSFNPHADDRKKHKIMKCTSKIAKGGDPYLPTAESIMRTFINRMQNSVVTEESSIEDSLTLEVFSPTLGKPGSSKSSVTKTFKSVTFSKQVRVEPVVTKQSLRSMGYSPTNVTQTPDNPNSSLPNLNKNLPGRYCGFFKNVCY